MGTSSARSSANTKYFTRGDLIPGLQVSLIAFEIVNPLNSHFDKSRLTEWMFLPCTKPSSTPRSGHSLARDLFFSKLLLTDTEDTPCLTPELLTGPECVFVISSYKKALLTLCLVHQEEIQHMRSSNDPITGLKNSLLEWGVIEESELKAIDKAARHEVEVAVEEAKKSPEPSQQTDMYTDSEFDGLLFDCKSGSDSCICPTVYYKGTAPMYMRGREREEVGHNFRLTVILFDTQVFRLIVDPPLQD